MPTATVHLRLASRQGFTLIELLIVVLIVGILIAVSAPSFLGLTSGAHDSASKQYLALTYREAKLAATENDGSYPASSGDPAASLNDLVAYLSASEPELAFSAGSDYRSALGRPDSSIVLDTGQSGQSSLRAYSQSGSGSVMCLDAPAAGAQSFAKVGDASCPAIDATSEGYGLDVALRGAGTGQVQASVSGVGGQTVDCPSDSCQAAYDSGAVTLTATPDAGSTFVGWAGSCTGTAPTCTVTMDTIHSATAIFAPTQADASCSSSCAPPASQGEAGLAPPDADQTPMGSLAVSLTGSGRGWVTAYGGDIDCESNCLADYPVGGYVVLHAQPAKGSHLVGWFDQAGSPLSGCSATDVDCTYVIPSTDVSFATAQFDADPGCSGAAAVLPGVCPGGSISGSGGSGGGGGGSSGAPDYSAAAATQPAIAPASAQPVDVLTASPGDPGGTPAPAFSYQWQRCDGAGANCQDVAGQTSSTYQLTLTDLGHQVRVVVQATNTAGSSSASAQTTPVAGSAGDSGTALNTPIEIFNGFGNDFADGIVGWPSAGTFAFLNLTPDGGCILSEMKADGSAERSIVPSLNGNCDASPAAFAFSSDMRTVAYYGARIHEMDAAPEDASAAPTTILANTGVSVYGGPLAFLPGDTQLAWNVGSQGSPTYHVTIANVDGSGSPSYGGNPAGEAADNNMAGPDGSTYRSDDCTHLYRRLPNGSESLVYYTGSNNLCFLTFAVAPDGHVALMLEDYDSSSPTYQHTFLDVIDADGSNLHQLQDFPQLTFGDSGSGMLVWSPDSSHIAYGFYSSSGPRLNKLYLTTATTGLTQIAASNYANRYPASLAFSPDGGWIVYLGSNGSWGPGNDDGSLWKVRVDNSCDCF